MYGSYKLFEEGSMCVSSQFSPCVGEGVSRYAEVVCQVPDEVLPLAPRAESGEEEKRLSVRIFISFQFYTLSDNAFCPNGSINALEYNISSTQGIPRTHSHPDMTYLI